MDLECNQIWRNDQYDDLFDELKEKYQNLGMEIPKKDLKKLPPEWTVSKITFDPAYALPFYPYIENPKWTCVCMFDEWFLLDLEYEQFKQLRKLSLEQENIEITELTSLIHEQQNQEAKTETSNQDSAETT